MPKRWAGHSLKLLSRWFISMVSCMLTLIAAISCSGRARKEKIKWSCSITDSIRNSMTKWERTTIGFGWDLFWMTSRCWWRQLRIWAQAMEFYFAVCWHRRPETNSNPTTGISLTWTPTLTKLLFWNMRLNGRMISSRCLTNWGGSSCCSWRSTNLRDPSRTCWEAEKWECMRTSHVTVLRICRTRGGRGHGFTGTCSGPRGNDKIIT